MDVGNNALLTKRSGKAKRLPTADTVSARASAVAGIGLPWLAVAIVVSTVASLFLINFLIKVAGKSKIIYLKTALGIVAIASGLLYLAIGL